MITITVAWSEAVVVTGTPQLAINSGGTANYSTGSGTNTLTFIYNVAAGQNSSELNTGTGALTLNGGTIFDTVTTNPNAAVLTLASPGSAGSISRPSRLSSTRSCPPSPVSRLDHGQR